MLDRVSFALTCLLLALPVRTFAQQSALILDDTPTVTEAADAASALGLEVTGSRTISQFLAAVDSQEDGWDVIVVDLATLTFTNSVVDALEEQVALGAAVIVSHGNTDGRDTLRSFLDVTCSGAPTDATLVSSPDGDYDVFNMVQEVPSPLNGRRAYPDFGDYCTPNGPGLILARSEAGGAPVIVTSRNNAVMYMGVVYEAFTGVDADEDELLDSEELLQNQIALMLELNSSNVIVYGTPDDAITHIAEQSEYTLLPAADLAELDALIADDSYRAAYFSFADIADADVALQSRIDALRAGGTPVFFFSGDLDGSAAWQTYFDLSVSDDSDTAMSVVPGRSGLQQAVFTTPNPITDVAVGVDGAGDSVDGLDSATLAKVARFGTDAGPAALLADMNGGLIVGGFLLTDLDRTVVDEELTALSAFFQNMVAFSTGVTDAPVVLVVSDATDETLGSIAAAAVTRAGYFAVRVSTAEVAAATILDDPINAVVMENVVDGAAWLNDPDLLAQLDGWLALDGPLVFAGVDLDAATDLAALLGVTATTDRASATTVSRDKTHLGRQFDLPMTTPTTLAAGTFALTDFGDTLELTEIGAVLARYPGEAVASVTTHNARVVVNGFSPYSVGLNDTDANTIQDVLQLLTGQLVSVITPQAALVLDDDITAPSVFGEAVERTGLNADIVSTPAAFAAAYDSKEYALLAIDAATAATFLSVDVWPRLQAWVGAGGNALLGFPEAAAHPDVLTFFDISSGALEPAGVWSLVEPFTDSAGLFRSPNRVPAPLNAGVGGYSDMRSQFTIDDPNRAGASYGYNFGPTAIGLAYGNAVSLNGFAPRALQPVDLNSDGINDPVALFVNQIIRSGRTPVPSTDGPHTVDEGTTLVLSAAPSFDPFGEALTFAWDLDLDGAYDDGDRTTATFDARSLDGPAIAYVGLRVTNVSGLSAVTRVPIDVTNVAPRIAAGSDRNVAQAAEATFTVAVVDVPGETFTIDWDFGDGGSGSGLSVTHTYDDIGDYTVTVNVLDDDGAAASGSFVVHHLNAPPTIEFAAVEPVDEGTPLDMSVTVTDPGNDPFDIAWDFGDGTSDTGAAVTHTFADNGTFTVTVTATDDADASDTETLTVTVNNVAPEITSEPPLVVIAGEDYVYAMNVVDPGADTIEYNVVTGPDEMTVSPSGELRWTPGTTGFEAMTIEVEVSDGDGGTDTQEWVITFEYGDSDSGGAPDLCEIAFGFDPDDGEDDLTDPDNDGLTVAEECIRGRDPTVFSGPPAPLLLSPGNNITWRQPFLRLEVQNALDPDGDLVVYDFQVHLDDALAFEAVDVDEVPTGQTVAILTETLIEDGQYSWRARAKAEDVTGPWSEFNRFVFNQFNQAPGRPTIVSPQGYSADNPTVLRILNAEEPEREVVTYDFEIYYGQSTREDLLAYSATDVPEGSGGQTEHTVDTVLDEGQLYTWRARARDPSGGAGPFAATTFQIDAVSGPPTAPVPTFPLEDDEIEPVSSVRLTWTNGVDPEGDRLEYTGAIATDADFTEDVQPFIVEEALEGDETTAYIPLALMPDTTYYWRVAATDSRYVSDFAFAQFTTTPRFVNSAPNAPVPVAPLAGTVFDADSTVEFIVDDAIDPDGNPLTYEFQIALDVGMGRLVTTEVVDDTDQDGVTSVEIPDLPSLSYFWRVRATDGAADGPWSTVNAFVIANPPIEQAESDAGGLPVDVGIDTSGTTGPTNGPLGGGGGCSAASSHGAPTWALLALLGLVIRRRSNRI